MHVSRIDSFNRLSSSWRTWRGSNKEGHPNSGAAREKGGYKDFNHNYNRDQLFTFKRRVYYLFNPSEPRGMVATLKNGLKVCFEGV